MTFLALSGPATIALAIRINRGKIDSKNILGVILAYAKLCLGVNLVTMCIITYLLGMSGVVADSFASFSFFTKYVLIASAWSFVWAYVSEIIGKYVKISFKVEDSAKND